MPNREKPNPLASLWNVLGILGGIISLSSMVENWSADLVSWDSFLSNVISGYRAIAQPAVELFFFWWPYGVSPFFTDYVTLSVMTISSLVRAAITDQGKLFSSDSEYREARPLLIMAALFWPLVLLTALVYKFQDWVYSDQEDYEPEGESFTLFLQWFGAIVLGVVVLLAINVQLS